jgi:hypothetical protein
VLIQSPNHHSGRGGNDNDGNAHDYSNDDRRASASEFALDVGDLDGSHTGHCAGWISLSASPARLNAVAGNDRCLRGNLDELRRRWHEPLYHSDTNSSR